MSGEVVHLHVDEQVVDAHLRIDFDHLAAIGRLAGTKYVRDHFLLADEGFFSSRIGMRP